MMTNSISLENDAIFSYRNRSVLFSHLQHWLFPGNPYSLDVKFNENSTRILATRYLVQAVNITDTNHEKVMVKDLRHIVHDSPLNASVFHPYFVFFDQFELVRPTSVQSMIVGAIIMMVISFIFIPNILCSLWVAFSIVSIELGVAGYMALWDVNLDSISMINLIMCIGFSVDFTAHICYTYMSSKARHPDDRVRETLFSLGMPIFQGATSTILGCIALLLAQSYIFLVFFKMIFLVIVFGALHGLFLLPVLLSLFGPGSCSKSINDDDSIEDDGRYNHNASKLSSVEKAFPHPYCLPAPQLALTGPFGNKGFLGSPYKPYGLDEKDQGIGTSGEDSSESSSSKSQRRQAIEDENTRRRYEEGWRRSAHSSNGPSQFQPVIDLYGLETNRVWTGHTYNYDDAYAPQRRTSGSAFDGSDRERNSRKTKSKQIDESPRYYDDSPVNHQYGGRFYADEHRRYPQDTKGRRMSDERASGSSGGGGGGSGNGDRSRRKYSQHEGIYRPNPHRSSSQHNLYYPRQPPQRSTSQHSLQELRHMGDIRFP